MRERGVDGRYPAHTRNVRMAPFETTFLPLSQENPLQMAAHTDKWKLKASLQIGSVFLLKQHTGVGLSTLPERSLDPKRSPLRSRQVLIEHPQLPCGAQPPNHKLKRTSGLPDPWVLASLSLGLPSCEAGHCCRQLCRQRLSTPGGRKWKVPYSFTRNT